MQSSSKPANYSDWSNTELLNRVTQLERQLKERTLQYTSLCAAVGRTPSRNQRLTPSTRTFDPSRYSTRYIALKFAYLGQSYYGFEHTKNNITALPTVEEVLWTALRQTRLISPPTTEPILKPKELLETRVPKALDISWEGCQYSKCGRTDRGVSAFGQVIGIRVRSNRPLRVEHASAELYGKPVTSEDTITIGNSAESGFDDLPGLESSDLQADDSDTFDPIQGELPYVHLLNSVLPPDIRVLAWCPHPPPDFDARFSCKERRYKYLFTNPAFTPTPGPLGFKTRDGAPLDHREGWLDIEAMREGAKRLVGLHDFRNFCKVDTSKQITNFQRRVFHADIELLNPQGGPVSYIGRAGFNAKPGAEYGVPVNGAHGDEVYAHNEPRVYAFVVEGSAFLWHQVRYMAAVLFLIGQGLESPELVSQLLDVEKNPCRPRYEIASDAPLILWDCIFPGDREDQHTDALDWIYAGDSRSLALLSGKGDGKFGLGGIVDDLWKMWRQRKIDEVLAGSLLDLVVDQGDGRAIERGGFRNLENARFRTQRVFDGCDEARLVGNYVPVMQKQTLESVEVQNAKYLAGKGSRRAHHIASIRASEGVCLDVPQ